VPNGPRAPHGKTRGALPTRFNTTDRESRILDEITEKCGSNWKIQQPPQSSSFTHSLQTQDPGVTVAIAQIARIKLE